MSYFPNGGSGGYGFSGYTCIMCGGWVQYGGTHVCPGYRPLPLPAPVVTTITYVPLTEERIREIVREEIERKTD